MIKHNRMYIVKIGLLSSLLTLVAVGLLSTTGATYKVMTTVEADEGPDRLETKIVELEDEILAKLASCETGAVKEPGAALIFDSNEEASVGKFQWQVKSVQWYVSVFYEKDIDRRDAILIALDAHPEISLTDLTKKVLFEDEKSWRNWWNCSQKHGLEVQVEMVKKLKS